jgi:YHS domain-containing protein
MAMKARETMSETSTLAGRIDAAFSAIQEKAKKFQAEQVAAYKGREQRVAQLGKLTDELIEIWKPRLEVLAKKFGDRVKVTPRIVPSGREATFDFQSKLAKVHLRFSAATDSEVRKLILSYDLEILPVLMEFTPHAQLAIPIEAVDKQAVAEWVDDRILDFVKTYLAMHENEYYLKDHMVEDPIAHVQFPKFAAAATLEWQGKTYYFVGEETRKEFAQKNNIAA